MKKGMKKMMCGIAMIPLVVTGLVLQFLPHKVPMHSDLEGNIDRWGNRSEQMIFPILIIVIAAFWYALITYYEKKAAKTEEEKAQKEAASNATFLGIVGVAQVAMFGIMHFCILYGAYAGAVAGTEKQMVDVAKVSCLLLGIAFIVLGNFMTRTKRNGLVGVRTTWSTYNDETWRKSNRFAALVLVLVGILTIITSMLTEGIVATAMLIIYVLAFAVVSVVYSKKVYDKELQKQQ